MNLEHIDLYDIKLKKKGLKKIRRILISKYGELLDNKVIMSEKEFHRKVKHNMNEVTYANLRNDYGVVSFNEVLNPSLAIYISEILNGNYMYIKSLMNLEVYNICGKEYVDDIFKNIEFKLFNKVEYNNYKNSNILKKNKVITLKKPFEK